ncbi:uncharacterized protein [Pleurodeles waltl]
MWKWRPCSKVMMPNSGVRLPLSNKSFMFKMGQTPCHRITFLQGSLMEETIRNLDAKLKSQPRKRKAPGSKDGPPIKKGSSSRKTQESSPQSSGDAGPQPKQRMSSLK